MQLTDKQLEAVHETKRNLQIIACAGSGKTETISRRIAEILKNRRKYYSVQVFMGGETRTMSLCPALINQ